MSALAKNHAQMGALEKMSELEVQAHHEKIGIARVPKDKNTSKVNFNGNSGNTGNKKPEANNHAGFYDSNLLPNEKKELGTGEKIGNKSPFEIKKGVEGIRDGVNFVEKNGDDPQSYTWLCDPLIILAETRDRNQSNWGRLLSWCDADGHEHIWACPAELLQSNDQSEFRRILASGGLIISSNSKARKLLSDYVLTFKPDRRARCVDRIGWHDDRYILNTKVIGGDAGHELVVYQGAETSDFSTKGSLIDWQRNIADMAVGNSRMIFSISCAFAGALVEMAGESGGGFQFTGQTSKGKTSTLIDPAASVWGHPDTFSKKWRTTTNGLEALCLARNHNVLILDDLGQIDPRDAGQAAYLISNGQGKARMSKEAYARPLTTWRTLLLSSGEIDLTQHIESSGQKAKGGQAVRLPSIPADTGSDWYTIENLHDLADGKEFSGKMKGASRAYYGIAGVSFLERLTLKRGEVADEIRGAIAAYVEGFDLPKGHPPELGRVAERFALVAYAGELSIKYGITGWPKGSATVAAKKCFDAFMAQSGGSVGHDDAALFNQVTEYLQEYGGSRFPSHDIHANDLSKVNIRSGFTRLQGGERQYLVESGCFKSDLCKGFDLKYSIDVLMKKGWLIPGEERKQQKVRIKALEKSIWAYVLTSKSIDGADS